ncbi:MAG TPA: aminotransferase class I/II-fold pyridoxal phosphate-dependent enzyme [Candidatus Eisenbacteria bacterium]|nr:aminotransferase class I/II-fold pyridoxal phosphate-dependent enzyme [Candidatus Eisenbacteria bacterium]
MATHEPSKRLQALPRYLFAQLEKKRHEAEAAGREVIDLSIGDPDLATPPPILEEMARAAQNPENHRYPTSAGMPEARRRIAHWFEQRYGVRLDPAKEIGILIGSKEGIGHFPLAYLNPGDEALVPDPGYPVYAAGTTFAGALAVRYPIREDQGFIPRIADLEFAAGEKTRLVFVNYPNNPTGATAPLSFYEALATWSDSNDLVIASDAAYSELYYEDPPPSILQVASARSRSIEFHSFSKTFNMTGWRLGFAVGAPELIDALVRLKANLDSGAPQAIQLAATWGLSALANHGPALRAVYRERRDLAVDALRGMGCSIKAPGGAFYLWGRAPSGETSMAFVERVFEQTGVMLTPGTGFGNEGEGFFRISLTCPVTTLQRALEKIESLQPWRSSHASASRAVT